MSSIAFLTGAKGQGCGGTSETGEGSGGGVISICPDGLHLDVVCDGHGACDDSGCHESCVPDCPEGGQPIYACPGDPDQPVSNASDDPTCGPNTDCAPPSGPTCGYVCQPVDVCPAGYHQEQSCSEPGNPGDPETPIPVDDGTGGNVSSPGYPGPDCQTQCVPDVCPPGTIPQTVCSGPPEGGGGGGVEPDYEQCWTECIPAYNACPPGQHPEQDCTVDDSDPNNSECEVQCVDDVPPGGGGTGGWIPDARRGHAKK